MRLLEKAEQIQKPVGRGHPGRSSRPTARPDGKDGKTSQAQRRDLRPHAPASWPAKHGKALSTANAKQTIEPIFGQTPSTTAAPDRFQRRGLAACRSEWRLITATHNLLKYWRSDKTPRRRLNDGPRAPTAASAEAPHTPTRATTDTARRRNPLRDSLRQMH